MSNIEPKRGQIYFINSLNSTPVGSETWSNRYALIISNDTTNATGGFVNIVYLTTSMKKKSSPVHVPVTSGKKKAIAMCEQIHSVDISRIGEYVGTIETHEMNRVENSIMFHLNINRDNINPTALFKKWELYVKKYHLQIAREQENLRTSSNSDAIANLQRQIEVLKLERDGYAALLEASRLK